MSGSRTRQSTSDYLIEELVALPWWASPLFGLIVWGAFSLVAAIFPDYLLVVVLRPLAPLLWIFVTITAVGSLIRKRKETRSLNKLKTLRDIRDVPWQEFEHLTAAYYREQGFKVTHTGKAGPDGGVDLEMRKDGEHILVQCKRYNGRSVGVQSIREFFGIVVSRNAHRGIFITTSTFSPDAMAFGLSQATLELIPGKRFSQMVHHLRTGTAAHLDSGLPSTTPPPLPSDSPTASAAPTCPLCQNRMLPRKARRGPNAGNQFWGCTGFPNCKGTRPF